MSDVLIRPAPSRPRSVAETVHHYVECHDETCAMCGADLTEVPWTNEAIDCVVCVELDHIEPEVCTCRCCTP